MTSARLFQFHAYLRDIPTCEAPMERREFLENMAGTAMVGFFGASLTDMRRAGAYAASVAAQEPYEFLTADQARLFDAVSAQIVPTDDTPGAREAHVVRFVDHALATFLKGRRGTITGALADLDKFSRAAKGKLAFDNRSAADQTAVLLEFEKKKNQSFNVLRGATMAGMFSHPEHGGNFNRIGWKLIGYEDRYSWAAPFGFYDR
jgi:gluconate 2-dehydrogenase gamma chain